MSSPPNLPNFRRVITGHDDEGKAMIFVDEPATWDTSVEGGNAAFCLGYITSSAPVDMNEDKDIRKYREYLEKPPGLVERGGSVLRFVDMAPDVTSPMHRTVSIDYGVVLLGEVELVLDSGEIKLLKMGDLCVQRGTNHAWRNASTTNWARMMYVLQPALPIEVNGKPLDEDLGHMKGVRGST